MNAEATNKNRMFMTSSKNAATATLFTPTETNEKKKTAAEQILNSAFSPAYLISTAATTREHVTRTPPPILATVAATTTTTTTTANSNNHGTIAASAVTGAATPISFANFKLSNAQNARDFLVNNFYVRDSPTATVATSNNKQSLRNKRYSQLVEPNSATAGSSGVDAALFEFNRNHPLIDNLIIHVENNRGKTLQMRLEANYDNSLEF